MRLENIKANFLGDSITEGWGASAYDKTYHQIIKRKYNMCEARGYGIGGTCLAVKSTDVKDNSFSARFSKMDDDAELVVMFGGTNDYGHGDAPLGALTDRTPNTFYGACHYIMSGLKSKYPHAKIVVMTPLHRKGEDDPCGENGQKSQDVAPLFRYIEILCEVAELYSLPIIDLYNNSGIDPNNENNKQRYAPDGLHPNDAGHELLAEYVGRCLENL